MTPCRLLGGEKAFGSKILSPSPVIHTLTISGTSNWTLTVQPPNFLAFIFRAVCDKVERWLLASHGTWYGASSAYWLKGWHQYKKKRWSFPEHVTALFHTWIALYLGRWSKNVSVQRDNILQNITPTLHVVAALCRHNSLTPKV